MITSAVAIGGVLLVFAFLVVPAVVGVLVVDGVLKRLAVAFAVALLGSGLGLTASWRWDLPTGAAIVTALAAVLAVVALVRTALRQVR